MYRFVVRCPELKPLRRWTHSFRGIARRSRKRLFLRVTSATLSDQGVDRVKLYSGFIQRPREAVSMAEGL